MMNLKIIKARDVVTGNFLSYGGEVCEIKSVIASEGEWPGSDLFIIKPRSTYQKEIVISFDSDAWLLIGVVE